VGRFIKNRIQFLCVRSGLCVRQSDSNCIETAKSLFEKSLLAVLLVVVLVLVLEWPLLPRTRTRTTTIRRQGSFQTRSKRFPFPSPRPSLSGRGRIAVRLVREPAIGFAGQLSEKPSAPACGPLSPGERVRVRGNATNSFQALALTLSPAFPSPRPSPQGRGRIAVRLVREPAVRFAGRLAEKLNVVACCSINRLVAAGIPACRRAGLPSPAERLTQGQTRRKLRESQKVRTLFPGGRDAALYGRQGSPPPRFMGKATDSSHPSPGFMS